MKKPSYIIDIPADEYHQATKDGKYISSHRLNLFRKCPALYKKTIDGQIVDGETEAFMLGRATHTFILDGKDAFYREYTVASGPINPKTGEPFGRMTKAYKDWAAAQTKPVINVVDFELIAKMGEAVHHHQQAAEILKDGFAEGTIRTFFAEVPVQTRMDWYDPARNILADLKTCQDVDRFTFDVRDFGYIHQLAFYAEAVRASGGKLPTCWLIAVEKKEPYRVACYQVTAATLDDAIHGTTKTGPGLYPTVCELKDCTVRGEWPTRFEGYGVL